MCIAISLTHICLRSSLRKYDRCYIGVNDVRIHMINSQSRISMTGVHIVDTYMTPVILTLLCELIICIPTSLTPIWHQSYLLYFGELIMCIPTSLTPIVVIHMINSQSRVSMTGVIYVSTMRRYTWSTHCELVMCIPTSLTPIWHPSYLLYFVSWSCVSPHHWHREDTHDQLTR
jgi:hypothetical protein